MAQTNPSTVAAQAGWTSVVTPRRLDRLEQVVVVTLNALLCWRLLPGILASDH